jgi:hypothetical protein
MGRTVFLMEGTPVKGRARVAPMMKWLTADANFLPSDVITLVHGELPYLFKVCNTPKKQKASIKAHVPL